jgi:tRNA-uridine 2-sulfurtransferase
MDSKKNTTIRALGICSGGLDSMLSALVLKDQGIAVAWVSFETPFFSAEKAGEASRQLDIPLMVEDITPVYMEMLKAPPAGYGKNMNPCMDCHSLMFNLAGKIMEDKGFSFLFSGEVLGQRPMSQTRSGLRYVEKHSGYDGHILRPLSALNLSETMPEKNGWVNRELLLDIKGRSRKPQMALADKYGISNYPAPAGGCLLTDKLFSIRLKDLFEHTEKSSRRDFELLKHGRHIRLNEGVKIIVGRTRDDNHRIMDHVDGKTDIVIKLDRIPGPTVLLPGGGGKDAVILAASICAGYSKAPADRPVEALVNGPQGKEMVTVIAVTPKEIRHMII